MLLLIDANLRFFFSVQFQLIQDGLRGEVVNFAGHETSDHWLAWVLITLVYV